MVGIAYAADPAPAAGGGFGAFVPLILIFVIFYFLLIRPQQKKAKDHQQFLANLQKGDVVVTSGGVHGTITGLTDKVVTLEIADNVRVKVSRGYVLGAESAVNAEGSPKEGASCKIGGG